MQKYVGGRYVPVLSGEWDITKTYEPFSVVTRQGDSFTSKTYIPSGIHISNSTYWVKSSDFNTQLASIQNNKLDKTQYSSPYVFKGACTSTELASKTGMAINHTWYITDLKLKKTWNGTAWEQSSMSEADYNESLSSLTSGKLDSYFAPTVGKNKFNNRVAYLNNTAITRENVIYTAEYMITTDYITGGIEPNKTYVCENSVQTILVFYDKNNTFISGVLVANQATFTAPANTAKYRVSGRKTDILDFFQITEGTKASGQIIPYVQYNQASNINNTKPNCKKGANIVVSVNGTIDTIKSTIDGGVASGLDSIALLVSNGSTTYTSNDVDAVNANVRTMLPEAIAYCNSLNVYVHLRCTTYAKDGKGSSYMTPSEPATWLENWKTNLLDYCSIVYPLGVRTISIANEMRHIVVESNRTAWADIISTIKTTYSGMKVAVNFNVYEKDDSIFDLFDIIGYNFYPCLTKDGLSTPTELLRQAFYNDLDGNNIMQTMYDTKAKFQHKKFWITEIGTQSEEQGMLNTWTNVYSPHVYNEDVQYQYYRLFFDMVYKGATQLDGMFIFAILDGGKSGTNGSNYIGKKAEEIVRMHWKEEV